DYICEAWDSSLSGPVF
nr:immunoglobulin light chain junction region [Macaca mulatta]